MKRIAAAILIFASVASAQGSKYAGSFLEIPVGAGAMGMGNAFVSLANDGTAFHYNPAGEAITESQVLSVMYSSQYGKLFSPLSDFFFIGYAQKLQDLSVSVDWVRLSVDNIPKEPDLTLYDSPAQREMLVKTHSSNGYFNSSDDAVYLNVARMFKFDFNMSWALFTLPVEFPVGLNFKIIHRLLYGRAANGVGVDGGFMLRFPIGSFFGRKNSGTFSFGMSLRDITNTRIAWDTQTTETVPRSSVWGASYSIPLEPIDGNILLAFNRDSKYGDNLLGAEYVYHDILSLRFGADASDLTAGAGIRLDFMRVDYAFLSQELGNVNRVSASFYLHEIFK